MPTYNLDANHNELNLIAEQLGIKIKDNARVKRLEAGHFDVWYGITSPITGHGVWVQVEYKTDIGKMSKSQVVEFRDCASRGLPAEVVRSVEDIKMVFVKYGGLLL